MRRIWRQLVIDTTALSFVWKRELLGETDPEGDARLPLFDSDGEEEASRREPHVELADCLRAPALYDNHILTDMSDRALGNRLNRLALNARTALSEQGVTILYVAFGLLRWYESVDSDSPLFSPLLLVPVQLKREGAAATWTLSALEEEVVGNHCLGEMLRKSYGVTLPPPDESALLDDAAALDQHLKKIRRAVRAHDRWEIVEDAILGAFSFQKISMWDDLGRNRTAIASHDLCRRIAGDASAPVVQATETLRPADFDDTIHPRDLHTILPCDSSQLEAILAAKNRLSLVVNGPPGTGKSQTIANIIAECLADGRTVLFVSEKAAALEVVKRRLDAQRLGDFCLNCHSHKASKKDVIEELGRSLLLRPEEYRQQEQDLHALHECRAELNTYVRALHRSQSALALTPYQVHGRLARLRGRPVSHCPVADVLEVDATRLSKIEQTLQALVSCRAVLDDYDQHPWRNCALTEQSMSVEDDVSHHCGILIDAIKALGEPMTVLKHFTFVGDGCTLAGLEAGLAVAQKVLQYPQIPVAWFAGDLRTTTTAIITLDAWSREWRQLRERLKAFRDEAIEKDSAELTRTLSGEDDEWVSRIRPHSARTVRELVNHMQQLKTDLSVLRSNLVEVSLIVDDFAETLHVPIKSASLNALKKLAEVGRIVAQTGVLKTSWFDDARRKGIRDLAAKCQAQNATIAHHRAELAGRMSENAFGPLGAGLAREAPRFELWWKRLFGWNDFRRRVAQCYTTATPMSVRAILDDMRRLGELQQQQTVLRQLEAVDEADVVRDATGAIDWESIVHGLDAIDRLREQICIPDRLIRSLVTPDAINRTSLERAAADLDTRLAEVEQCFAGVKGRYAVTRIGAEGTASSSAPEVFIEFLKSAEESLARRIATLEEAITLLRDDADVNLATLPASLGQIVKLRHLRAKARQLVASIACLAEQSVTPELFDWSLQHNRAQAVQRLLDTYHDVLPDHVRTIVSDSASRESVQTACDQIALLLAGPVPEAMAFLTAIFPPDAEVSTGIVIQKANVEELRSWMQELRDKLGRLREWLHFAEVRNALDRYGVRPVLDEVLQGTLNIEDAADAFLHRFYRLWLQAVYAESSALRCFTVEDHERHIDRFRKLDQQSISGGFKRIRSKLLKDPNRPHAEMCDIPASSELGILMREVNKKRRQLSLRQLFAKISTLLPRLKPCLMMSPLAVSTYLDAPKPYRFDVVIFDEASQVRPFDAIGAIYRGSQLIVAGDQRQMPPSTYFDRIVRDEEGSDPDENGDVFGDVDSILELCEAMGLRPKQLRWHYRSRRESLIAFSNYHFYDDRLITFPSIHDGDGRPAVTHHFVANGRWLGGSQGGENPVEARTVRDLILQHIRQFPQQSLGVITFNQKQQLLVLNEVETIQQQHPELLAFFQETGDEPFFVKNLENVQGDERDRIIISVGYGPDEHGNVAMRFGPLNLEGGERRLNVAVTRAKHHVTLVSSLQASDIDLARTQARGAQLLRAYLEYAVLGTQTLPKRITRTIEDDGECSFESEVERALRLQGMHLKRRIGCSEYRMDLAVVHPEDARRLLVGVECDGRAYRNCPTARDRDRLRPEVLHGLGWNTCRVWSTDWIRDPAAQVARIVKAYQGALNSSSVTVPESSAYSPPAADDNEEPMIPSCAESRNAPRAPYASIDGVSTETIKACVLRIIQCCGATALDDLVKTVAGELGFQRVGTKIRKRVAGCVRELLKAGALTRSQDNTISAP
jgi:very-short-patch-repair endonuclease